MVGWFFFVVVGLWVLVVWTFFIVFVSSWFRGCMYLLWKILLCFLAPILKQALKQIWGIPLWVLAIWFHNKYLPKVSFETEVYIINIIWKITTWQLALLSKSWDFNVGNPTLKLFVSNSTKELFTYSWRCASSLWPSIVPWALLRNPFLKADSSYLCAWATENPLLKDTSEIF